MTKGFRQLPPEIAYDEADGEVAPVPAADRATEPAEQAATSTPAPE